MAHLCAQCDTPLQEGAQFCASCGTQVNLPNLDDTQENDAVAQPKKGKMLAAILAAIASLAIIAALVFTLFNPFNSRRPVVAPEPPAASQNAPQSNHSSAHNDSTEHSNNDSPSPNNTTDSVARDNH